MTASLSGLSERVLPLRGQVRTFMRDHFFTGEHLFYESLRSDRPRWTSVMVEWKSATRTQGLWSLFLPDSTLDTDLTHLEYTHTSEEMGRSVIFKCSARVTEMCQLAPITATQGYDVSSIHLQEFL